jgi:hypothetical protein
MLNERWEELRGGWKSFEIKLIGLFGSVFILYF